MTYEFGMRVVINIYRASLTMFRVKDIESYIFQ